MMGNIKARLIKMFFLLQRIIIAALLFILFYGLGYAQDNKEVYFKAVEMARAGEPDFAYMHFKEALFDFFGSKYKKDALFATGEYYFSVNDYSDASLVFFQLVEDYADSKAEIFALAYLLKISRIRNQEAFTEALKELIINSQRLVLAFKEYKEIKYNSPFQKRYKVIYYIDKIEFYLNGELFEKILF